MMVCYLHVDQLKIMAKKDLPNNQDTERRNNEDENLLGKDEKNQVDKTEGEIGEYTQVKNANGFSSIIFEI